MYVHPVVLQLESALTSDSLRTLCKVLAGANGKISPAPDNPDRTRKPIMDAALTVRAFLRFVELRHGSGDDLTPADFSGKCGSGVRVLLRKCREYEKEVFAALQTRVDDVGKMIRAFYDLTALLTKFLPFFRTVIEKAIPAIIARKREPIPRLISFLEAYGDIQLTFLYEATLLGTLDARLDELDPSQLLETADAWMQKARSGELAIITVNKVRTVVRAIPLLELELSPQQRAYWIAGAIWASAPEMTESMGRAEARVRDGVIERADPGEIFGLAAAISLEEEVDTREVFEILGNILREVFSAVGPERASEVLSEVESRPPRPYNKILEQALQDISARFAVEATAEQLEHVLELWVKRSFALTDCPRSVARVFLDRPVEELQPGPTARSAEHLSGLGVEDKALAPLIDRLLEEPEGWALGRRAGPPLGLQPFSIRGASALLGRQLWPAPEAPPSRLSEVESALRLVGPKRTPARKADIAAGQLVSMLATQLPGRAEQVEAAVTAWQEEASDPQRLATVVAPLLLEEATEGPATPAEEDAGDLARSATLLSKALRAEPLGLRSAEWALSPFAGAAEEQVEKALAAVSTACGAGGSSELVVERASRLWLSMESPPAGLGPLIITEVLKVWEEQGVRGEGLDTLRKVYAWLMEENRDLLAKSVLEPSDMGKSLLQLETLLKAIDGEAPSLAELKRAREGVFSSLGRAGRAALADAVATAWAAALPGVTPGLAGSHFELFWNRQEDQRALAENLKIGAVEELKWQNRMRLEMTFGATLPGGMQGTPAWRVEGRTKVPWFVTEELVAEAYGPEGEARAAERKFSPSLNAFVKNSNTVEKAKKFTGGVCMYCGSQHDLQAKLVFPIELGGANLHSNLAAVCPVCVDFITRLGPERWSEALFEKPEKAAQAWWEAQKKANMKTLEFLNANVDVTTDLKPAPKKDAATALKQGS